MVSRQRRGVTWPAGQSRSARFHIPLLLLNSDLLGRKMLPSGLLVKKGGRTCAARPAAAREQTDGGRDRRGAGAKSRVDGDPAGEQAHGSCLRSRAAPDRSERESAAFREVAGWLRELPQFAQIRRAATSQLANEVRVGGPERALRRSRGELGHGQEGGVVKSGKVIASSDRPASSRARRDRLSATFGGSRHARAMAPA